MCLFIAGTLYSMNHAMSKDKINNRTNRRASVRQQILDQLNDKPAENKDEYAHTLAFDVGHGPLLAFTFTSPETFEDDLAYVILKHVLPAYWKNPSS